MTGGREGWGVGGGGGRVRKSNVQDYPFQKRKSISTISLVNRMGVEVRLCEG